MTTGTPVDLAESVPTMPPSRPTTASAPVISDGSALTAVAGGDARALSVIYDRHSAAVFGLAVHMTRDRSLAEDIVQETFVNLWKHAGRFDADRASARTWIMAIAHNRAIDAMRRRRATTVSIDSDDAIAASLPPSPDIWPAVVERHDARVVRNALSALPETQRRAIELAYFRGMTQHEIAFATGAPLGTVKSRVRLGLLRLRDILATDLDDHRATAAT